MIYLDRYNEWLRSPYIDQDIKEELKTISGNQEEIKDRFYKNLEFGTGGMRGVIGAGTNRINKHIVARAIQGLADFINQSERENKSCVIAHDSRHKSKDFSVMAARVLAASGVKTYLYDGIRSTPELSFAVRELGCTAGIVFTASHNPPEYNGFKVYWDYGCQMLPEMAEELVEMIEKVSFESIQTISYTDALDKGDIVLLGHDIDDKFINNVKAMRLRKNLDKDIKIVYTPLHGTGSVPVRRVLRECGYDKVFLVEEQLEPDPNFTTVRYPNPEDEKAFEFAYKKAVEVDADIVIANDPDADRVGLSVKSESGEYKLLSGNQVGPLFINYILSTLKEKNSMPTNPLVIKTIVTSELGRKVAENYSAACLDTLTGFKYIGEKMELFAKTGEKDFIIGYEESIGYTMSPFVRDKDAITMTLIACEMAAYYKMLRSDLLNELENLYVQHGYYVDDLRSLTMEGKEGGEKIIQIMEHFRNAKIDHICGFKVASISDYQTGKIKNMMENKLMNTGLPESNVLKFLLDNGSWFVLRPSGTEPKIKIYFSITGKDIDTAKTVSKSLINEVMDIISQI
ncbi:MAG: Phosphomannomutase [Clostridiales bacterium 38_11]|nr:MAG: Phosphomannomutase [Clostridiales bacterium 38_11]